MKRFTLLTMLVALFSLTAFAQKGNQRLLPKTTNISRVIKSVAHKDKATVKNVRRAAEEGELVTPPSSAVVETWAVVDGSFMVSGNTSWEDYTAAMPTVNVAIDGNDIYLQGLAYYFEDAWIKGTIDGTTAIFPNAQYLGTDEYGSEYLVGSDTGSDMVENIVFEYDAEAGTLTATTPYLLENAAPDSVYPWAFWYAPVFSANGIELPDVVEAPETLVTEEYSISAKDDEGMPIYGALNVGFDGSDVYVQGLNYLLPESWIKGTLAEGKVTFPKEQFFGKYDRYLTYFNYGYDDAVFTYDQAAGTLTAADSVYVNNEDMPFRVYGDLVLTKVVEKVATPANPVIDECEEGQYGWTISFTAPNVDTDGNGLLTSKLYYKFYVDIDKEVSPLTFTSATHKYLEEDLTEIPYGFSENYDFYLGFIYLNDLFSEKWNKIGIQTIYYGGGEERASEINWFTISEYDGATFNFNEMDVPTSASFSTDGDITEPYELRSGRVYLTVSPAADGAATANRFWSTKDGPQLRVYSGTMTFQAGEGKNITSIVFNTAKWNDGNTFDSGEFADGTWTGAANKVVLSIAGNTQINSIEVTTESMVYEAVEAPEDLKANEWLFETTVLMPNYDEESDEEEIEYESLEHTGRVQVGFYNGDVYIQGLCPDMEDAWVKGTLADGKVTIPANTFLGVYEAIDWSALKVVEHNLFITAAVADPETAEAIYVDIVFNYDADAQTLTTDQKLFITSAVSEFEPEYCLDGVKLTAVKDVAATPAKPSVEEFDYDDEYLYASFSIPAVSTQDEPLLTSKLFYVIWVEKNGQASKLTLEADLYKNLNEDLTEIPYLLDDDYDIGAYGAYVYLNQDETEVATWTKIGIQSIYYGGGETHASEIAWYEADAINSIQAVNTQRSSAIYNLSGQRVQHATKGLYIINGKKVVVK